MPREHRYAVHVNFAQPVALPHRFGADCRHGDGSEYLFKASLQS